ncbi:MAG: D-ribose pyranase [Chloroflexi bacterium]|nr:D-ribose pyranase [Chloroflexota bacterium]MBK7178970.1 D-ribose pyranase [Chloroflexota bacterium]MBK8933602.1 D-ribose pyranase [Chloroflexota bacterium]
MKKGQLLNQPISAVIAGMGHTDELVIGDAGLPIPAGPQRIDLALTAGIPAFLDTLEAVLSELAVETAVIATEMITVSPNLYAAIQERLGTVRIIHVPHEALKVRTQSAKAIIRTGEFTPYANIILSSGVVFG